MSVPSYYALSAVLSAVLERIGDCPDKMNVHVLVARVLSDVEGDSELQGLTEREKIEMAVDFAVAFYDAA